MIKHKFPFWDVCLIFLTCRQTVIAQNEETFVNPIFDANSADPCVTLVGEFYYLLVSTSSESELTVYKSTQLTNFRNAESKIIYKTDEQHSDLWASEMHEVDGDLYIYFAMNRIGEGHNRMYAIRADDPMNPMGEWSDAILMFDETWDIGGIDGTIMKHGGKNYFVYSQFPRLVIADMIDPVTPINETKVLLRVPSKDWEVGVCEGPYFIYNQNVSYMVFAVGGSFDASYALGLMSIPWDKDPMITDNWWYGDDAPVFWKNEEEEVYGPGHAAFTTSPDKSETWFVYHAHEKDGVAGGHRIARSEKITWDPTDGKPIFPRPHGYFNPQPIPSGQSTVNSKDTFTNPIISGDSAEPHITLIGSYYYLTLSTNGYREITIFQSKDLTNFRNTRSKVVLEKRDCLNAIWASEMHEVDQEIYIYTSFWTCDTDEHLIYVMKALDRNNPLGEWGEHMRVVPESSRFSGDPTILQHINGKLYMGFTADAPIPFNGIALYLAEMDSPTHMNSSSRVMLKAPTLEWEGNINQGPSFLKYGNNYFLVYSAGYTFNPNYCLRMMSVYDDLDPLIVSNWWMGDEAPIFQRNEAESVYGPGHSSFVTSQDGSELWMSYHASIDQNNLDGFRVVRIEKIGYDNQTGRPVFPLPHGYFSPMSLPSGQVK